jgi:hypothetical protein
VSRAGLSNPVPEELLSGRFSLEPKSSEPDSNNYLVAKRSQVSYNWGWREKLQEDSSLGTGLERPDLRVRS